MQTLKRIILFVIAVFTMHFSLKLIGKFNLKKEYKTEYQGTIKFIEFDVKNNPILFLNKDTLKTFGYKLKWRKVFSIGDSVSKNADSRELIHYKFNTSDSTFKIQNRYYLDYMPDE